MSKLIALSYISSAFAILSAILSKDPSIFIASSLILIGMDELKK